MIEIQCSIVEPLFEQHIRVDEQTLDGHAYHTEQQNETGFCENVTAVSITP